MHDEVDRALQAVMSGDRPCDRESWTLDFKLEKASREDAAKDLAEAASCFANAKGGSIIVGVADRERGAAALIGTTLNPEWLVRRIWELTEPHLLVEAELADREGVRLLIISVPMSVDLHAVSKRVSHRVGTSCEPMSPSDQVRVMEERRGIDWSAAPTEVPAEEADYYLRQVRRLLRNMPDQHRSYGDLSDGDLLRALGLVSTDGYLLKAGALLLTEPESSWRGDAPWTGLHARDDLIVYQYRKTPAGEPAEIARLGWPLLWSFERCIELIDARIDKSPVNLPNGQQVMLEDLPTGAVREAIANAIMHRDYRLHGPVTIEHSPTRLVVTSPGPLVPGVTVDNILSHPSKPRNRTLTKAVRMVGLAEEAGVGIDRMYREMIRAGHRPPEITEEAHQVRVTLSGGAPNKPIARFVASLPPEEAEDTDTMLVLFSLLSRRTLNATALSPIVQKPVEEAQATLHRLSSDSVRMLEPTRETARRRYPAYRLREHTIRELGTAVAYKRRTADEIDRKITSFVHEFGHVTNKAVQLMFDVRVERASEILGDLVARELLVKTSTNERGPGVRYGPGPKLPAKRAGRRA